MPAAERLIELVDVGRGRMTIRVRMPRTARLLWQVDGHCFGYGARRVLAPAATVRSRVAQNKFLPKTRDYNTPLLLAVPHCPPGYSEPPRPSTHRFLVASARYAIVSRCIEHGLTMLLERLAVQDLREDVRRVLLGPEVLNCHQSGAAHLPQLKQFIYDRCGAYAAQN